VKKLAFFNMIQRVKENPCTGNKIKTSANFTYYGGFMRNITIIFKNSTVKTTYRNIINIFKLLAPEKQTN